MSRGQAVVLILAASLASSHVEAATVAILQSNGVAASYDALTEIERYNGTEIPVSHHVEAVGGEGVYSILDIDRRHQGEGAVLSFNFAQKRRNTGYSQAYEYHLWFTVSEDTTYSFSGWYSVSDIKDGDSGRVYLEAKLQEQEAERTDYLFRSLQSSGTTSDESFVLGNTEGDETNNLKGSIDGQLYAGEVYQLDVNAVLHAYEHTEGEATGSGNITMIIGDVNPVPEPTSLALWSGLGIMGLVSMRRRRRRR